MSAELKTRPLLIDLNLICRIGYPDTQPIMMAYKFRIRDVV